MSHIRTTIRRRAGPRRAVTLLELLMALALMVIVGALALPAMRGPFANQRLRKAGELIRVEWTKASLHAMRTGQIQMFQFQAGERLYSIQPYVTEQDWLEVDATQSLAGAAGGPTGQPTPPVQAADMPQQGHSVLGDRSGQQRELPEGVLFGGVLVQSDTRSVRIQQDTGQTLAQQDPNAALVLFYPDGTTSDAELVLSNEYGLNVRVTLRGLTGIAKVSSLLTTDELQQIQQQQVR